MRLPEKRANIVKDYLESFGVAQNRMEVIGMGNQNPIASNETRAGKKKNRRVEVTIIQ